MTYSMKLHPKTLHQLFYDCYKHEPEIMLLDTHKLKISLLFHFFYHLSTGVTKANIPKQNT